MSEQWCDNCNPPCTCSVLKYGTDYRCGMHPDNVAKSPDEQRAFAAKFDERVANGQAAGR